jgi:hypothetical protein
MVLQFSFILEASIKDDFSSCRGPCLWQGGRGTIYDATLPGSPVPELAG